jgi:two-component system response regulator WspF
MRVAIVNDLALAREVLRRLLESVPGYQIAWMAVDGADAVRRASQDLPDVILMDLFMPVMDGVEATRRIMAQHPCPILLVTSSVTGNFTKVYAAMGYGALDAVDTPLFTPDGKVTGGESLLARLQRLKHARNLDLSSTGPATAAGERSLLPQDLPPLVALGASTGGPEALAQILGSLNPDFPGAIVIVQHIAGEFAPSLAAWLQSRTSLRVSLAVAGGRPEIGRALVAATNDHLTLDSHHRLEYIREPVDYPYRPSVDVLFSGIASCWPRPGVAALLTGMGADGARGLLRLRKAGWRTIAQDRSTSVVYGMPQAAVQMDAADKVLPLPQIAAAIVQGT